MTCQTCGERIEDKRGHRHERPQVRYARWTAQEQRRQIREALKLQACNPSSGRL